MDAPYPGKRAKIACAVRTREELLAYAPVRPVALRDEMRVKGMHGRCSNCGACPLVIRALAVMLPVAVVIETAEVVAFRLAS